MVAAFSSEVHYQVSILRKQDFKEMLVCAGRDSTALGSL